MKIVVGMPTGSSICTPTHQCMTGLLATTSRAGHTVIESIKQGSSQPHNQNEIFWFALEERADAVMLIDSDMIFPHDAVLRLLAHDKDFVGAPYRFRTPPYGLLAGISAPVAIGEAGLLPAEWLPSGMILVRHSVLTKLAYPWMEELQGADPAKRVGHDINFCRKARAEGFEIFADFGLAGEVYHIGAIPIGLRDFGGFALPDVMGA